YRDAGPGRPKAPAEVKPLLVEIPASLIVEAGSPQAPAVGSSQGCMEKRKAAVNSALACVIRLLSFFLSRHAYSGFSFTFFSQSD
nr:hypothetical protein [Candidatus Sigynarchaeota archaeon]